MSATEQARPFIPIIRPSAESMSDAEKLQVLWLTVFGSQRPPVRGLVDAFAELDEIKAELAKLASTRRFVIQLLTLIISIVGSVATAAGVIIAALK